MARGKASSSRPSGKSAARPQVAASAADALDALDAEPAARRQLNRRHTDDKVERGIEMHLPNILQQQLQIVRDSSGRIVAQRVKHDMKQLPPGGRLGNVYWRQIRVEYGFHKVRVEVSVRDPNMAVGDDLLMAMKVLLDRSSASRCISPLTNLLTYRSTLNQMELVGIIGALNTLHDTGMVNRAAQEQLWVDLLKCIVRHLSGLHWL